MNLPFRLVSFQEIDSTNTEAMRRGSEGEPDGLAVTAVMQTAGRGRHGRTWQSPAGNLYLSVLLRPDIPAARLGEMAFVAALAVADAVDFALGRECAALKWPNDVLANDAKLAGILVESDLFGDRVNYVVIGIGINVATAPKDIPYPAISLRELGGAAGVDSVRDKLLQALARWRGIWDREGFAPVRAAWQKRAWRLGAAITVAAGAEPVSGCFSGIDDAGALLLKTQQGERRIASGSVAYESAA